MERLASHILEKQLPYGRIFVAPTKTRDIVTIEGSVLGGERMLPADKRASAALTARLLDAGTSVHTKDQLRESLAARGITLSFSSGDFRTHFSATCLPEDLTFTLSIITECLSKANFPAKEIVTARSRAIGSLVESKTDTGSQGMGAFSRLVFDTNHENYIVPTDTRIASYESVARGDLTRFQSFIGKGGLVLAITGDVEKEKALSIAERAFSKLSAGTTEKPEQVQNKKEQVATENRITIAGKANVDVFIGASIALTRDDELFLPLTTTIDMLGGGFADHLMQTVRERDGLTYGIRAASYGFGTGNDGCLLIRATFSPDLYEKGVVAARKEIAQFFAHEINEKRLSMKKDDIAGSYLLGLSTTYGIGTEGKPLSYIDEYPELIKAITLDQVTAAAALIPLDKLSLAAAGTFTKK
jgi:zinc protease